MAVQLLSVPFVGQAIRDLAKDFSPVVESGIVIEIVGMPTSDITNLYAAALGLAAAIPGLRACTDHAIVSEIDYMNKAVMVAVKYSASGLLMAAANEVLAMTSGSELMRRSPLPKSSPRSLKMPVDALPGFISVINKEQESTKYEYIGANDNNEDGSVSIFVPNQGDVVLQTTPGDNPKLGSDRGTYSGASPKPMTYAPAVDPCSNPTRPAGSPESTTGWASTVLPYLKNLFGVT